MSNLTSEKRVEELRKHARAWGVTADTPDAAVFNETAMARECARAASDIEKLRHALQEIAKGNGAYSLDQYQFACNVIENMKGIAQRALDGTYEIE